MTKPILGLLIFIGVVSCGQNKSSTATKNEQLLFDTNKIAILPIDTTNHRLFKNTSSTELTKQDLKIIYGLLTACINSHNFNRDTTNTFSKYIHLSKYKLQYVPFIDSKGDKKVYINGFCVLDDFTYWKQTLVDVADGGSCFFHVTLNLTTNKYEKLFINAYG